MADSYRVLHRDGVIEMSYDQIAAKDAIVGLYPVVTTGTERVLATLTGEKNPAIAPHLNIQSIKVSVVVMRIALERLRSRPLKLLWALSICSLTLRS